MKYGRKFWLTVMAFITFTALLVGGYLDKTSYVTLVSILLTGFLTANVVQKATAKTQEVIS